MNFSSQIVLFLAFLLMLGVFVTAEINNEIEGGESGGRFRRWGHWGHGGGSLGRSSLGKALKLQLLNGLNEF
uniref:Uncharacterized protein n=1 Tax=Meloidogyne hapla TaxID=6305 RepID=A0A1I8BKC4_MELHA